MNEQDWNPLETAPRLTSIRILGVELRPGDQVRLSPRSGGDIFDLALAGRTAVIDTIEQDYEGRIHLAVIVDDDPGRDLGELRQPGHRFFFSVDEVQPFQNENRRVDQ